MGTMQSNYRRKEAMGKRKRGARPKVCIWHWSENPNEKDS